MVTIPRLFNSQLCYHVYNCGVERRTTFTNADDYRRFLEISEFYLRAENIPFSQFSRLVLEEKFNFRQAYPVNHETRRVSLLAYCLMPNHFHFIIKMEKELGLSQFVSEISNSYTKYFNTRYKRLGYLFQGSFKAKEIDSEESLMQLSRYIHLNPAISLKVAWRKPLLEYPYSSYINWIHGESSSLIRVEDIKKLLSSYSPVSYQEFVEAKIFDGASFGLEDMILEKAGV